MIATVLSLVPPAESAVATAIEEILGHLPFNFHAVHARLEEDYRGVSQPVID